ncbi:hypothetical protein FZC66_15380 [Priestia megaterium]|nr:hypothetical protein FZC66_15380 [Priestia megaterium]
MKGWLIAVGGMMLFSAPLMAEAEVIQFEEDVKLEARRTEGKYQDYSLEINGQKTNFPHWMSLYDENVRPLVKKVNVDNDSKKELVVLLPQKAKKNTFINEAKVLKVAKDGSLNELILEDARKFVLNEVKYYRKNKDFHIQINDEDVLVLKNEQQPPNLTVHSFVSYEVDHKGLKARINVTAAGGKELGEIAVRYENGNQAIIEPSEMVFKQKSM